VRAGRLIIAVESPDDPAYRRATELAKTHREPAIDVVVANVSNRRGQKCTNILAALTCLTADDRFVVMLDADICPQSWWLGALVAPLATGDADLVNGHRWLVPKPPTLASVLVAHIDRALAVLPRLAPAGIVWGGSLALTRETLEILDLARTLDREVVEDLPIGGRVAETGLRLFSTRSARPHPAAGKLARAMELRARPGRWRTAAGAQLSHPARRSRHPHPQCRPPRTRSPHRHPRNPHPHTAPRPRSARRHGLPRRQTDATRRKLYQWLTIERG